MRATVFTALTTVTLALSPLTSAAGSDALTRLGPSPTLGGGEYSTGGGLTVAMEVRQIGSNTGLCGVWAQSAALSIYARNAGKRVLSKGRVTLNGRVVTHNFNFLRRVDAAESYAGAAAGCVTLNRPWQASDASAELEIRIPRQKVFFSSNAKKGASQRVTFGPSDVSNPAMIKGALLPPNITTISLTPRSRGSLH